MTTATTPYYREPYLWLIWGLLGSVVIASFITLSLAMKNRDGLVVDDYYKQGLAINQSLEAYETARLLGIEAQVKTQGDALIITLNTNTTLRQSNLVLHIIHPTDPSKDIAANTQNVSTANSEGLYQWELALVPTLKQALNTDLKWQLVLEAKGETPWKVRGNWLYKEQRSTALNALDGGY